MTEQQKEIVEQDAKVSTLMRLAHLKDDLTGNIEVAFCEGCVSGLTAAIQNPSRYGIGPVWVNAKTELPDKEIVKAGEQDSTSTEQIVIKVESPQSHIHVSTGRMQSGKWFWWNGKEMSPDFKVLEWTYLPDTESKSTQQDVSVLVEALEGMIKYHSHGGISTLHDAAINKAVEALKQFNE